MISKKARTLMRDFAEAAIVDGTSGGGHPADIKPKRADYKTATRALEKYLLNLERRLKEPPKFEDTDAVYKGKYVSLFERVDELERKVYVLQKRHNLK